MRTQPSSSRSFRQLAAAFAVAGCLATAAFASDLPRADESEAFSVLASLQQIPLSAATGGTGATSVSAGDLDAAAAQARAHRPTDSSDSTQLSEFFAPLMGAGRESPRMFVWLPVIAPAHVLGDPNSFIDEVGFSPGDISTYAIFQSHPFAGRGQSADFVVVGGVSANPDLPEIIAGVQTAGQGNDYQFSDERSITRLFGRPLRIAERDGMVAMSWATDPIIEWSRPSRGPTLAADRTLSRMARRLDEETVVSAYLETFVDPPPPDGLAFDDVPDRPVGWSVPYVGAGLGWAADGENPRGVIVLAYETPAEAQRQLAFVTAALAGDARHPSGSQAAEPFQPMSEFITVDKLEVRGAEIVANISFPSGARVDVIAVMLGSQNGPFAIPG